MARPLKNTVKKLSKRERLKVLISNSLYCNKCEKPLKLTINRNKLPSIENGVFHHIVPLIYGGENLADNICLLYNNCHNKIHSGEEKKEKYFLMYEKFLIFGRI